MLDLNPGKLTDPTPQLVDGPEVKKLLVDLLPFCRGWAVIQLISFIVEDNSLIADKLVQREVLVYGMANNDGIPMEVAFTIANAIDVSSFCREAAKSDRIYVAIVDLMNTLLTEPHPLGGLADIENHDEALSAYISILCLRRGNQISE